MDEKKKFDKLHVPCVLITLGFLACSVFLFRISFFRLLDAGRDFGLSVAYYFTQLLGFDGLIIPTVNGIPASMSGMWSDLIPVDWTVFKLKAGLFWQSLWNGETFRAFVGGGVSTLSLILKMLLLFGFPLVILVVVLYRRALKKENPDHGAESRPLRTFKRIGPKICRPVKRIYFRWLEFFRSHSVWWKLWLGIWAYNLNLGAVVLGFLAYYFYFAVSFDFVHLYLQIYKLGADLSVLFGFVPLWCWLIGAVWLFCRWRKKTGLRRLRHMESRIKTYLKMLPIVVMIVGTMGKKKTTLMTDMSLSYTVMFRDMAFEIILQNDLKFPNFPWQLFEDSIRKGMDIHRIYSARTCRDFVRQRKFWFVSVMEDRATWKSWQRHCKKIGRSTNLLFGYDLERYGLTYNNGLEVVDLFDVLEVYAQAYLIYVLNSSLMVSNYAVREDAVLADLGNFPQWDSDFFERDPKLLDAYSRHAHILDFDVLRLGRKVLKDNPKAGSFEFGVVTITEAAKERGNQNDTKGLKRDAPVANQVNDLFNFRLKMARHPATVEFVPFVRMLLDDQRPESLGADARELCDLIYIRDSGEQRNVLPFFGVEETIDGWFMRKFERVNYGFRFARGDMTLSLHLFRKLTAAVHRNYMRKFNQFGYCVLGLERERGTQDSGREEFNYPLMNKKVYSRRFATDCYQDYFDEQASGTAVGIADYPEYDSIRPRFEEMDQQHSFFIREMTELEKYNDKEEKPSKPTKSSK